MQQAAQYFPEINARSDSHVRIFRPQSLGEFLPLIAGAVGKIAQDSQSHAGDAPDLTRSH